MVRRRAAKHPKPLASMPQRRQITLPFGRIFARLLAKLRNIFGKSSERRINHRVRPKRWQHSPRPSRRTNSFVLSKRIKSRIRSRKHLNPKPLIQRTRQKLRRRQFRRDRVEINIGRLSAQPLLKSEQLLERIVQPQTCRRSPKQIIMLGKNSPHLARITDLRHTNLKVIQRNALAVQHAMHVMVRLDKQCSRIRKRLVLSEPRRLGMSMRTENRQLANTIVKPSGDGTGLWICGKKSVVVKQWHRLGPKELHVLTTPLSIIDAAFQSAQITNDSVTM